MSTRRRHQFPIAAIIAVAAVVVIALFIGLWQFTGGKDLVRAHQTSQQSMKMEEGLVRGTARR